MATLEELNTSSIEAVMDNNNCAYFQKQRDYETEMVKKFSTLLYLVGVAVAVSIIGLIISIAVKEYGVAAATSIGTVVTGAAVKFLLNEQKDHRAQAAKFVKLIKDNCP